MICLPPVWVCLPADLDLCSIYPEITTAAFLITSAPPALYNSILLKVAPYTLKNVKIADFISFQRTKSIGEV